MTIANMTTEWGALSAWFPVDVVTTGYLAERYAALLVHGVRRFTTEAIERWRSEPPRPDDAASYAARIVLDLSEIAPCVAGPDTVQRVRSLDEVKHERIAIQKAYLLSCVNGREHDLEAAADVLGQRQVAPGVKLYIAAASREVQSRVEASGAWQVLLDAGAIPLPPGCGPCIGLGEGLLEPGEVAVSATNRNFRGRMGARDATVYLASPEVVALSAAHGFIDGRVLPSGYPPACRFERLPVPALPPESVDILPGFPAVLEGRALFLPQDDLNTDGIYGKDYTYRELTRAEMARVVLANYDPSFAETVRTGDIVVGGWNFGTGSSREQAVTALQAAGVSAVVVGSASQTYLRNAYNNGFLCLECPALVTRLRAELATSSEATIALPSSLLLDFRRGVIRYADADYAFVAPGPVPQALVVAGGIEQLVMKTLARSG